MSIIFFVCVFTYTCAEIVNMQSLKTSFYVSDFAFPIEELYNKGDRISLEKDFKDSFNFIIGTTND